MKKRSIFIISIVVLILISFIGSKGELVENLEIPVGVGADIEKNSASSSYIVPFLVYSFEESTVKSNVLTGESKSMGETRENRQLKAGKRPLLGLNRVFVVSEDAARNEMKSYIDIWLNNPEINDRSVCVVSKEKSDYILNQSVKGYSNAGEFIEGMVKSLRQYNFFPMQYSIIDIIVRVDDEGRNILLPYIEVKDNNIETTGLAIFRGSKMVAKTDISEARIINILKENNVRGIFTLQLDSKKYINSYTYSKRKVSCSRENEKYKFIIDLDLKGNIVSNQLYKDLDSDIDVLNKFQQDMKNYIEKTCNESINNIKYKYKTDVLDLGRVAAAKYGRDTGVDWNKVVMDSDIKVNVKYVVDSQGRGDY